MPHVYYALVTTALFTEYFDHSHLTVPAFDFHAAMDVTAFAQKFSVVVPDLVLDSDGFADGKRLHLRRGVNGTPEWVPVQCSFKVDETKPLGEGSFRTCYQAWIRDGSGQVKPMVAKKCKSLPAGKTDLDFHKESSGTYGAVASLMAKFKQTATEKPEILASPRILKMIQAMRVRSEDLQSINNGFDFC